MTSSLQAVIGRARVERLRGFFRLWSMAASRVQPFGTRLSMSRTNSCQRVLSLKTTLAAGRLWAGSTLSAPATGVPSASKQRSTLQPSGSRNVAVTTPGGRKRAAPKQVDGTRRCGYGHCYAPLPPGTNSAYCHDDHAEAARKRRTVDLHATEAAEKVYDNAVSLVRNQATVAALTSVVWFTSTQGTAMHGSVVTELRTMLSQARAELYAFGRDLHRDGTSMNVHRVNFRAARQRVERLAAALDQVLAKPEAKP
jgi:hypothetical protein